MGFFVLFFDDLRFIFELNCNNKNQAFCFDCFGFLLWSTLNWTKWCWLPPPIHTFVFFNNFNFFFVKAHSFLKIFSRNFICFCISFIYNLTSHFWIFIFSFIQNKWIVWSSILHRMFVWGLLNCFHFENFYGKWTGFEFYGTLLLFERLLFEFLAGRLDSTLALSRMRLCFEFRVSERVTKVIENHFEMKICPL